MLVFYFLIISIIPLETQEYIRDALVVLYALMHMIFVQAISEICLWGIFVNIC